MNNSRFYNINPFRLSLMSFLYYLSKIHLSDFSSLFEAYISYICRIFLSTIVIYYNKIKLFFFVANLKVKGLQKENLKHERKFQT